MIPFARAQVWAVRPSVRVAAKLQVKHLTRRRRTASGKRQTAPFSPLPSAIHYRTLIEAVCFASR